MMKRWVGYMTDRTTTPDLWTGYNDASKGGKGHFGDWLDLTQGGLVCRQLGRRFHRVGILLLLDRTCNQSRQELGEDVSCYEALYSVL